MKRRKFIQWLAGAAAAIALDPVIGGQAVWGTDRPKVRGLTKLGGYIDEVAGFVAIDPGGDGVAYLDPWQEIQDKLVATLTIPPEYIKQIMRPPFMFRDRPEMHRAFIERPLVWDERAEEQRLLRLEASPSVQALAKRMVLLEDANAIVGGLDEDVAYHKKKLFQALKVPSYSDPKESA